MNKLKCLIFIYHAKCKSKINQNNKLVWFQCNKSKNNPSHQFLPPYKFLYIHFGFFIYYYFGKYIATISKLFCTDSCFLILNRLQNVQFSISKCANVIHLFLIFRLIVLLKSIWVVDIISADFVFSFLVIISHWLAQKSTRSRMISISLIQIPCMATS